MSLPILSKFHTVGTISLVIDLIFPIFQTIGRISLLIGTIGFVLPDQNKTKNARDVREGWKRNEVRGAGVRAGARVRSIARRRRMRGTILRARVRMSMRVGVGT